jgi:2-dehydro-3-deoxyphosphogluconate aldolase/(4S)-4-hydroxy-2-oxoglutarate aldolase
MSSKEKNLERLLTSGIIPVVRAKSAEEALKVVEAVREGGIDIIEITMTVPNAIGVIETIAEESGGGVLLGAGTVLDAETARASILVGAEFIVAPCFNEGLVKVCRRYSKIVIPGAMTPTEIVRAWEQGADLVKIFPAQQLGGPDYIKAIKAPLPQVLLNPTGGVNLNNAADYIRSGASVISVGSALIDKQALAEGKFEILTRKAQEFLKKVQDVS